MRRPIIGIPTQTLEAIPNELPRCWVMSQRYVLALVECGGIPWVLPLLPDDPETMRAMYDRVDGVLLPGGADIDPASYGEVRGPHCGRTDAERDRSEVMLTRWALAEGKPLLGICRGVQIINIAAGGTLYQDIAAERAGATKHDYFPRGNRNPRSQLVHDVSITPGTRLAAILDEPRARVNSMHHQGIKTLGAGLVAAAIATDGVVEGVEKAGDDVLLGVQWHPEDLTHSEQHMQRLFGALLDAANDCAERAAAR